MIGQVMKWGRKRVGLSQEDLSDQLMLRGFSISRPTISVWERSDSDDQDPTWNPRFIRALADIFDVSEIEVLHRLGFDVVPEGYTRGDVEFALAFRQIPDHKKHRILELLMLIMDILEENN